MARRVIIFTEEQTQLTIGKRTADNDVIIRRKTRWRCQALKHIPPTRTASRGEFFDEIPRNVRRDVITDPLDHRLADRSRIGLVDGACGKEDGHMSLRPEEAVGHDDSPRNGIEIR